MLTYVLDRLKELSTWRGILAILTAAGITLTPEQAAAVTAAGLAAIGVVAAFFPDKLKG